jgi:hypothetical protein
VTDLQERASEPMNSAAKASRSQPGTDRERSPAEIEAEIERTRAQLAGTIDEIAERVHPKAVARRGAERVRETVVDGQGRPKKMPAAVAAAGAAAMIALSIWRRRR